MMYVLIGGAVAAVLLFVFVIYPMLVLGARAAEQSERLCAELRRQREQKDVSVTSSCPICFSRR